MMIVRTRTHEIARAKIFWHEREDEASAGTEKTANMQKRRGGVACLRMRNLAARGKHTRNYGYPPQLARPLDRSTAVPSAPRPSPCEQRIERGDQSDSVRY